MKELYAEGLANHGGPESWVDEPRGSRPSVDRGTRQLGYRAAKKPMSEVPTPSSRAEGNMRRGERRASPRATSRGPRPRAGVEPFRARTGRPVDSPRKVRGPQRGGVRSAESQR